MKSSSSSSSSSSTSASVTPGRETQLLSSSASPPPRLSLQSPELQAEFLQERQKKLQPHRHVSDSSVVSSSSPSSSSASSPLPSPRSSTPSSSPRSPSSSSPSPSPSPSFRDRSARLSLSSPELLSELKQSRTRSLRHVPAHNGLTTVFSGRGRRGGQVSGSTPSTQPASQKPSP